MKSVGNHVQGNAHSNSIPPKVQQSFQQAAPSLCQVIAMVMCYRRLALVFLWMPTVLLLGPLLANVLLKVLNLTTQGFGSICLALAAVTVFAWNRILKATSPSPEKYAEAYQKSQVILPLATIVFYSAILRMLSGVVGTSVAEMSPNVSWNLGVKPAIGVALINAATLFRFIGPASILRCSTVPLVSNGFINLIRAKTGLWTDILSLPRPKINPPSWHIPSPGRRYQFPALSSYGANMVATCIVGYLVAEYVILPHYQDPQRMKPLMYFTCLATMTSHLHFNFDGIRHELNPKHYDTIRESEGRPYPLLISGRTFVEICKRVVAVTAIVVGFGIASIGISASSMLESNDWPAILLCIATSITLGLYAAVVEEAGKSILFVRARLQRFVREITSGRESKGSTFTAEEEGNYVIDTALYSLLHGDTQCIRQIGEPTTSNLPSYLTIESYETERCKNAGVIMSNVLLGKKGTKGSAEVALEEDILRISLLESLGGSSPTLITEKTKGKQDSTDLVAWTEKDYFPLCKRHHEAIEYWVKPATQVGLIKPREPTVILLTRALTAYVSGLGIALSESATASSPRSPSWLLRPGTLVAAEYSAVALSRIFAIYLEQIKKSGVEWRRGQLSTLIPAALNALFRLHCGILDHAKYLNKLGRHDSRAINPAKSNAMMDLSETFTTEHPDLQQVLHAAQEAAKHVVRQMGDTYTTTATQNATEPFCQRWIDHLMATASTR